MLWPDCVRFTIAFNNSTSYQQTSGKSFLSDSERQVRKARKYQELFLCEWITYAMPSNKLKDNIEALNRKLYCRRCSATAPYLKFEAVKRHLRILKQAHKRGHKTAVVGLTFWGLTANLQTLSKGSVDGEHGVLTRKRLTLDTVSCHFLPFGKKDE